MQVTSIDGDMLDLMIWRAIGRTSGALETVLEANPRAASLPQILPAGVVITIPPEAEQLPPPKSFKLWE